MALGHPPTTQSFGEFALSGTVTEATGLSNASVSNIIVGGRAEVLDFGHANADEALEEIAREIGADLIVAGAYGHNRLREWAFCGMTRSLLGRGVLDRLLSN